jgi:C-terminal processing protease CtpA/Prc
MQTARAKEAESAIPDRLESMSLAKKPIFEQNTNPEENPRMQTRILIIITSLLWLAGCSTLAQPKHEAGAQEVFRPWGIIGAKITDALEGVIVTDVLLGSTAEKAGIRVEDKILSIDGKPAGSTERMLDDIRSRLPKSTMALKVKRNGQVLVLSVTVGEFPIDEQLWLMASSAAKAWDSQRARELCDEFDKKFPATNRYALRFSRLKASLDAQNSTQGANP